MNIFESIQFLNEGIFFSTLKSREKIVENYKKIDEYFEEVLKFTETVELPTAKKLANAVIKFRSNKSTDLENALKIIMHNYNHSVREHNNKLKNIGFSDYKDFNKAYTIFRHQFLFNKADLKDDSVSDGLKAFIRKYYIDEKHKDINNKCAKELVRIYEEFIKFCKGYGLTNVCINTDNPTAIIDTANYVSNCLYEMIDSFNQTAKYIGVIYNNIPERYLVKINKK